MKANPRAQGSPQTIESSPPFQTEAEARAWAESKIGEGTRNYVEFDPKNTKVLERDGVPVTEATRKALRAHIPNVKNPDVKRALEHFAEVGREPTNPKSGQPISVGTPSASDRIYLTNYGKALSNDAFRAREELKAAGNYETVFSGEPVDFARTPLDVGALEGKVAVPIHSDLTRRGETVERLGGIPLSKGVKTEGGASYAADPANVERGAAYASTGTAAKSIHNRLTDAAEATGKDPVGIWTGMGETAFDFAHFPMEIVGDQMKLLKPHMTSKALREFDAEVRKLSEKGNRKTKPLYPNADKWVGWESDEAIDQLMGRGSFSQEGAGAMRKAVLDRMKQARWQNEGMPDYTDLGRAVNEPRLSGIDVGDSGAIAFRGEPGAPLIEGLHGTYDKGIPGTYLGGMDTLVPGETMWQGILGGGKYTPEAHRKMSMDKSYQEMTPEIVDSIQALLQALRQNQ